MDHLGDITQMNGFEIAPVDVVTGGSPCQDLSVAGKRAGLAGARSGLYMEQIRVIKELRNADRLRGRTGQFIRPRFMVWENVAGAFSSNHGEDFQAVLEEAARTADPNAVIPQPPKGRWPACGAVLGDGWSLAWRIHDAQFWGVPQRRRRIALVADFGGHAAPEILFVRKSVFGDIDEGKAAGKAPAPGTGGGVGGAVALRMRAGCEGGGKGALLQIEKSGTLGCSNDQTIFTAPCVLSVAENQRHELRMADVFPSISTGGGKPGHGYPCVFENHSQDSRLTGPLEIAPTVAQQLGTGGNNTPLVMATGQSGAELLRGLAPTLNCNHEQPIVAGLDCRNGRENGDLCGTLQSKGDGGFSYNCIHPVRIGQTVRRLTPLECERLQGFPDGWTDIGPWTDSKSKLHKESSDSARYKALGNSIALPPWRWILLRITACYERPATLGSLFDGIGGFPLIWERLNGPGTCLWASEIEEFPMAVTRFRFNGKEMCI